MRPESAYLRDALRAIAELEEYSPEAEGYFARSAWRVWNR
jgi:hypothetical protein